MSDDYYNTLGISKSSHSDAIKKAYRKLALVNHPDKNGDVEKFKKINEAYETLSDPEKRRQYDRFGKNPPKHGSSSPFNDIFANIFKQQQQRQPTPNKTNTPFVVGVTLKDVYNGCIKNIKVTRRRFCMPCNKTGSISQKEQRCGCDNGKIVQIMQFGPGIIKRVTAMCPTCKGYGYIIQDSDKCTKCKGNRVNPESIVIPVDIKKGTRDGQVYVFSKEADDIPGQETAGDLIIKINIKPDDIFKKEHNDLYITKKINLLEALSGYVFTLTHMDDTVLYINVSHVIKPNQTIKINNQGMPDFHTKKNGDLYVTFDVEFPERIEKKDGLQEILGQTTNPIDIKSDYTVIYI